MPRAAAAFHRRQLEFYTGIRKVSQAAVIGPFPKDKKAIEWYNKNMQKGELPLLYSYLATGKSVAYDAQNDEIATFSLRSLLLPALKRGYRIEMVAFIKPHAEIMKQVEERASKTGRGVAEGVVRDKEKSLYGAGEASYSTTDARGHVIDTFCSLFRDQAVVEAALTWIDETYAGARSDSESAFGKFAIETLP